MESKKIAKAKKIGPVLALIFICTSFLTASAQMFQSPFFHKRKILTDYPNRSGMIALWQMDENPPVIGGKIIYDFFGTHNGVVTGSGTTDISTMGKKFRALAFPGSSSSGGISQNVGQVTANTSDFNRTSSSNFTVLMWLYYPAAPIAYNFGTYRCFLDFQTGGPSYNDGWCLSGYTSNTTLSIYGGSGSPSSFTVPKMKTGVWYHAAVSLSLGTSYKVYWNGSLVSSGTIPLAETQTITRVLMALDTDSADGYPLTMDEVSVWNRILSDSEIQTIYSNQTFANQNYVNISNLTANPISSNGFTSTVTFAGDINANSTATLYYCDATASPGCSPTSGSSISMAKSGNLFTGTVSGLAYSPGDYVNFQVTVSDADGVNSTSGSPTTGSLSGQLRLTPNTPTLIYRSVAVAANSALTSGSVSNTMTISGTTATFSSALANNIGVGDVIQYDPADSTTPSKLAFISGRTSSTVFTVLTSAGATPTAGSALQNWKLFRAYTSLSNALAGTANTGISSGLRPFDTVPKNLVTANQRWMIAVYGNGSSNPDSAANITSSWTTDIDRYVQVYSPILSSEVGTSQRVAGVWDNTKWNMIVSDNNSSACRILCSSANNTRFIGLQVQNSAPSGQSDVISFGTGAGGAQYIAYNIVSFATPVNNNVNEYCISLMHLSSGGTAYAYNNITYGCGTGIGDDGTSGNTNTTQYIFNNTVYGGGDGIRIGYSVASNTIYAENNIAYNNHIDIDNPPNNPSTVFILSNLTKDTTAQQVALSFANVASNNFLLGPTDTAAYGAGTDLGHPAIDSNFKFNDDILGNPRPAGSWDAGANQH